MARRPRGSGSVRYHAATGRWRATLPKRLDEKERPVYFPTYDDAARWLDAEIARLDGAAAEITASVLTVRTYVLRWLDVVSTSERWSPRSIQAKLTHFQYLGDHLEMPLADLTRVHLQSIVAEIQREPAVTGKHAPGEFTRRRALAPGSVHAVAASWRRAFRDAVEDRLMEHDPTRKLSLPKRPGVQRRPSWTPAQTRVLVPSIAGHRYEAEYALIFGCGLRVGEVRGIAWDHVDELHARVWIGQQADYQVILRRVKGGENRGKWVPLPPSVLAALLRRRATQTWEATYVCEHQPGRIISRETLTLHLKRLAASLGLPEYSLHAGRHAVGNALGEGGIPLATIADRLRHESRNVTSDWYMESSDQADDRATELLERLFSGGDETPTRLRNG